MPPAVPESCPVMVVFEVTPVPVRAPPLTIVPDATAVTVITLPEIEAVKEAVSAAMLPVTEPGLVSAPLIAV